MQDTNDGENQEKNSSAILVLGRYSGVLCSHEEEDWYKTTTYGDNANITTEIVFNSEYGDIDCTIEDEDGNIRGISDGTTSLEFISILVQSGSYFLRVYSYGVPETGLYYNLTATIKDNINITGSTTKRVSDSGTTTAPKVKTNVGSSLSASTILPIFLICICEWIISAIL